MFLELIEKMENWSEDWIWHVRIYSTCWINCQNLFHFSRISTFNEKWKKGLIFDMSSLDVLHMQGTSCEIFLIFECTQNMETGMNRYIALVS